MKLPLRRDTAPIRPGEELPLRRLQAWLVGKLEGVESGLSAEQFPSGHSNLTYLVQIGEREFVLRRPPLGPVPLRAHDMVREFHVLEAIHPHFPLAPRVHLLCEDESVLGVPFYLMERRRGIVVRSTVPGEFQSAPDFAERVSAALVDCLARLHRVDVEEHGLTRLGKPEGFLERQVRGWTARWQAAGTESIPEMNEVTTYLAEAIPESAETTIVHNDFKLDNLMLDPADPGRITGVLDWEMATVGDPMVDLGLTLCYWLHSGAHVAGLPPISGWYTREQFLERYVRQTGRELRHIGWHEVLGIFKLAVILQQIYHRYVKGQTSDERFRVLDQRVRALTDAAVQLRRSHGI